MTMRTLRSIVNNTLATVVSLIMITPVYLVFVNALKTKVQASSMGVEFPTTLQWQNFATVIERGKLATTFGNSLLYATAATLLWRHLGGAGGLCALAQSGTRLNRGIYFFIIMGIAMPTNFVTLTKVMQWTQLINTQLGIIVLYAATHIPINVFLIYAFIQSLPRRALTRRRSWMDAARSSCSSVSSILC